jgi:hypothetical protein
VRPLQAPPRRSSRNMHHPLRSGGADPLPAPKPRTRLAVATEFRQLRTGSRLPMLEEQPGWMGFRSSIDGFNVNQHPSTGPGGAQDHQDPVAYSNGRWPSGTGATMRAPTNVMGAGGSIYQAPGRDQSGGRFSGGNGPSGHSGNWQRVIAPRDPRLLVALAGTWRGVAATCI